MISMQVIKRNNSKEDVSFDKVLNRIRIAADGLEVNPTLIAQRTLARIYDGVKTSELDELAAQLSISLMTTNPDYGTLASRIAISNHHRNTSDKFTEVIHALANQTMTKTGEKIVNVSQELIDLCEKYGPQIDNKIDYNRDYLFDYFGFKTLEKLQYLLRDTKGNTLERPQHLIMRVSLALWGSVDLEKAFETYDLLSQKYFIHATPTNFNAGTPRQQLSSCFMAGTQVHTLNGVKNIEDVIIGDEVVTHKGQVKKVSQLHKNPLNNRIIYDIKLAGTPTVSVTGNHRLWSLSDEQGKWGVKPGWNSVEYLRIGDWVAIPNKKIGDNYILDVKQILDNYKTDGNNVSYRFEYNDNDTVTPYATWKKHFAKDKTVSSEKQGDTFNRYWIFDETMMELIGIWYGDGCVVHGKNSAGNKTVRAINIVSYHTNSGLIEFVTKTFYEKLGIRHVTVSQDSNNMVSMTVNNQYIAYIFKEIFKYGFDGKRIPAFFNRLSYDSIVSFLSGLTSSDGCVNENSNITIQLTNPPLISDIFYLARSVGIPITMTIMNKDGCKATGRMNLPSYILNNKIKKVYNDNRLENIKNKNIDNWKQSRIIDGVTFMRINQKIPTNKNPEFVYTLGIEDDHSYSVGGFIAENCFLLAMKDDSIVGIYDTLKECAQISKHAGGIGLHIHNIRAKGALIKGTNGTSNGIVPMLRNFNDTARYVDQCWGPGTLVVIRNKAKEIWAAPKLVPIETIQPGDEVLTSGGAEDVTEVGKFFYPTGAYPSYSQVEKLVCHNYTGVIYRLKTRYGTPEAYKITTTFVTPQHPLLALKNYSKFNPDEVYEQELQVALNHLDKFMDYITLNKLAPGDWIAHPTSVYCEYWAGRDDYPSYPAWKSGGLAFSQILEISEQLYNGPLYDLEVAGNTHDYTVAGVGIAHNGGGKRNGSFAIYLEPWHADVEDFLKLKLNTGSEEERCRDLFYALWIPDLFMERVEKNAPWTLFCPSEAPGLADVYGDEFKALYEKYEAEGRGRKQIDAQKLWFKVLDAQIETGTPYLLYKDACNKKSNQKNLGIIKSSNLCVAPETYILTDKGQYQISELTGQEVNVWNGDKWSKTTVIKTGENQKLMAVGVNVYKYHSSCMSIDNITKEIQPSYKLISCTYYHKFILEDGSRIEAQSLKDGHVLKQWSDENGMTYYSVVLCTEKYQRIDDTYCFNEPENHAGVFNGVLTGNCTEIIEYSAPDESAVCNLASIALPMYVNAKTKKFNYDKLKEVVKVAIKNLNRVIDINYYPTPETKNSNMRHRPVGLGVQGLADVFAMMRMSWESDKAAELNQRIFEHIYYAAVESSSEIAEKEGPYSTYEGSPISKGQFQYDMWSITPLTEKDGTLDWASLKERVVKYGVRNSLLMAPMPTASTSQILGFNECIEPFTSNIYTRRTLAGEFIIVNKYLMKDLEKLDLWNEMMKQQIIARNGSIQGIEEIPESIQKLYKTSWEIKQKTLIDMAVARGAFICQSQSLNLFVADPNYAKLTSMHFYSWKQGLKTGIYYLRTRAPVMAQKFTIDPELQKAAEKSEQDRLVKKYTPDEGCTMCSA
jgi:ribonucleotide reductase alpha subunit